MSDAEAAALVSAGRVQIRWRQTAPHVVGHLGDVGARWSSPDQKTKDLFQSDLKASTVGLVKGKTYLVEFRFLAAGSNAAESGPGQLVDLGSRSFTLKVTRRVRPLGARPPQADDVSRPTP